MKAEKFKVIQFIREFIIRIDVELQNYPKKEIEIKNRIRVNTYDLLEIAYEANITVDEKRKAELIFQILAKIKVIDFLLNLSLDKNLITEKKYYKLGKRIDDIAKFANGWAKNTLKTKIQDIS